MAKPGQPAMSCWSHNFAEEHFYVEDDNKSIFCKPFEAAPPQ